MIRFTGHLDVDCAPSVAFDRLADMSELERWNPNVSASRRVEGGRLESGSKYESTIVRGPIRMTAASTLVDVEHGRRVRYEGAIALSWSVDELSFEPNGTGCRITFFNETRLPVWMKPIEPVLNAAFQPQARRAVLGARQFLGSDLLG